MSLNRSAVAARALVRRNAATGLRLVSLGLALACGVTQAGAQVGLQSGAPVEAAAGPTVVSAAPASVGVTIYRNPHGGGDAALRPGAWLGGYALVSEERDVDLPAGSAVLRFEGVAAGMLAESAIITGLPDGVREKNLDADLLSPRNLYARAFGRPVMLRRQRPGGQVTEEEAIIRSGPDGAAILQTRQGFEVANCGGLKDGIVYNGLPAGMNARPTFSVATQSDHAQHVRIRLSYLAWGFDWRAHYVLALRPGAREAEMTAWLTLASSDDTSFPQAQAGVVAGRPNMADAPTYNNSAEQLVMACNLSALEAPPPPPPPPAPMAMMAPAEIVVTSARRMMKDAYVAQAEALGDLKFYRIPVPTSVSAHGQKQVALIAERPVKLALIHTATIEPGQQGPARRMVRLRNRREDGLGLALPGGQVSVLEGLRGAHIPAGEGHMADKAEGETVDIQLEESPQVQLNAVVTRDSVQQGRRRQVVRLSVTNANRWPVRFEGKLALDEDQAVASSSARLGRKDGLPLWETSIPAQGRVVLTYVLADKTPVAGR
ncbi:DUF4139 domain-containing protein [Novosphingobium terrae]|uniref:DUF4139 domain-containing protein n=1 Tax=Novosphingobium terrae TaxID=2726189 RepID=UPI00197D32D0|nr:hypothetical protein [Novosphingobium terrae]